MNQNLPAAPASSVPASPEPIRRPLDPHALAVVLAGIRTDSQREPDLYIRDTVVPHGGE